MKGAARIELSGVVQGVGFRPFIHRLAEVYNLRGWVLNSGKGVIIDVEGERENIRNFYQKIFTQAPPLARIEKKRIEPHPPNGYRSFEVKESLIQEEKSTLVSPDISICFHCLDELFDAKDRRYRYPFINCTNCGPRFSIIRDLPYDREKTTMDRFTMCSSCQEEYLNISQRRYHTQPTACPDCGPQINLMQNPAPLSGAGRGAKCPPKARSRPSRADGADKMQSLAKGEKAIEKTIELLKKGKIIAIKGLGGFHLACDATSEEAVRALRKRKRRPNKPLAIMSFDVEKIRNYCQVREKERELLKSPQRPIVLLKKRKGSFPIAESIAPGNGYLGVMLPYTPLHYLLLENSFFALVMTSGNLSGEPLITDNHDALSRLSGIADYSLIHNRDIYIPCDDSIVQVMDGKEHMIRRSRGYIPLPIDLEFEMPQVLACGGELKNTFCLTRGRYAFLSQHIGDLKNWENLRFYERCLEHFKRLFSIEPEIIAHDLHPEYLSTKYAVQLKHDMRYAICDMRLIGIQHHHAHIVSCMVDNGVKGKVIGVAFDGTGYGTDGKIWGGEFLIADYQDFERMAHLKYIPLPGGNRTIEEPYRMAISYLHRTLDRDFQKLKLDFDRRWNKNKVQILLKMIDKGINSPLASSMGRLFDAVSSLIGICDISSYEAQAAIELQQEAEKVTGSKLRVPGYQFEMEEEKGIFIINPEPIILGIVEDLKKKVARPIIAAKFHNTVAEFTLDICRCLKKKTGVDRVALSGGVFQNRLLLKKILERLRENSFTCYTHSKVPTNDGGISLGQAVIAAKQYQACSL